MLYSSRLPFAATLRHSAGYVFIAITTKCDKNYLYGIITSLIISNHNHNYSKDCLNIKPFLSKYHYIIIGLCDARISLLALIFAVS